jgi:excinuclease ABC subunit B
MSIKDDLPLEDIPELISQLEKQMKEAAKNLDFEEAAKYRDRIKHLRDKLLVNTKQLRLKRLRPG